MMTFYTYDIAGILTKLRREILSPIDKNSPPPCKNRANILIVKHFSHTKYYYIYVHARNGHGAENRLQPVENKDVFCIHTHLPNKRLVRSPARTVEFCEYQGNTIYDFCYNDTILSPILIK